MFQPYHSVDFFNCESDISGLKARRNHGLRQCIQVDFAATEIDSTNRINDIINYSAHEKESKHYRVPFHHMFTCCIEFALCKN